ncbi:hypothetical protein E9993_13850 [Labilibacter sediminis]|nr:hypothetical protein E9993_13850 [Labilibacter sediminis]
MNNQKTYLVCPLNWGLGHASRMIPIIDKLVKDRHHVILGGDGDALTLLQQNFPKLSTIRIADIRVNFRFKWMLINLLVLIPKILKSTIKEHFILKQILKNHSIDVVISDNRYGLWTNKARSIIVTHQLMLKLPFPFRFMEYCTHLIIKKMISRFHSCWVPDYKEKVKSLSGDLSRKYPIHSMVMFIGPLSRFSSQKELNNHQTFQVVAIISGPEPSRSKLEKSLIKLLQHHTEKCLIIQGKPNKDVNYTTIDNVTLASHMPTAELKCLLKNASIIICRSGYSSIMDLEAIKLKAILIPTPGQTEQEYLSKYLKNRHTIIQQDELDTLSPDKLFSIFNSHR